MEKDYLQKLAQVVLPAEILEYLGHLKKRVYSLLQ